MTGLRAFSKTTLAGSAATLAVIASVASVAWACVPAGNLALNPATGTAGSQTSATTSGFPDGETVEVRWDSLTGPVLDSGTGPGFTKTITIPVDATGGTHIVVAAVTGEHAEHSASRTAFTIPGDPVDPGPPGGGSGQPLGTVIPPNPFAPLSSGGTRAKRYITLGASKARVARAKPVTLRGKIRAVTNSEGCASGQAVALERRRRSGARFKTFSRARSDSRGKFTKRMRPTRSYTYRARLPSTTKCLAAVSRTKSVRATG